MAFTGESHPLSLDSYRARIRGLTVRSYLKGHGARMKPIGQSESYLRKVEVWDATHIFRGHVEALVTAIDKIKHD